MKNAPSKSTIKRLQGFCYLKMSRLYEPELKAHGERQVHVVVFNTLRHVINFNLKLFPNKIHFAQRLLPTDMPRRLEDVNFVIRIAETQEDFWKKSIMSNETFRLTSGILR